MADRLARIARRGFYWFLALAAVWLVAGGKGLAIATFLVGTFIYLGFMGAHLWLTRPQAQKRRAELWERGHPDPALEAILLGPVSNWVAEGEAKAVRDWEAKFPSPRPAQQGWVRLVHPGIGGVHDVPDNPGVVEDFQTRGWVRERDPRFPWPMLPPEKR